MNSSCLEELGKSGILDLFALKFTKVPGCGEFLKRSEMTTINASSRFAVEKKADSVSARTSSLDSGGDKFDSLHVLFHADDF